jgi:hypothetical protein
MGRHHNTSFASAAVPLTIKLLSGLCVRCDILASFELIPANTRGNLTSTLTATMGSVLVTSSISAILVLILYHAGPIVWRVLTSPLRHLPGPPSESILWGNIKSINGAENSVPQEQWVEKYGPIIAYKGILGVRPSSIYIHEEYLTGMFVCVQAWRLWIMDTRCALKCGTNFWTNPSGQSSESCSNTFDYLPATPTFSVSLSSNCWSWSSCNRR